MTNRVTRNPEMLALWPAQGIIWKACRIYKQRHLYPWNEPFWLVHDYARFGEWQAARDDAPKLGDAEHRRTYSQDYIPGFHCLTSKKAVLTWIRSYGARYYSRPASDTAVDRAAINHQLRALRRLPPVCVQFEYDDLRGIGNHNKEPVLVVGRLRSLDSVSLSEEDTVALAAREVGDLQPALVAV